MAAIQKMFRVVSDRSRRRKLDLFYSMMRPEPHMRILDLGGEASGGAQDNKQLLDIYPHRDHLVLVNLFFPNVKHAVQTLPGLRAVCGDGLRLPFADKSFDICYCNAVVEHLFNWDNQQRFAAEIRRVARSWFVTTPNRWFPFEAHMRLPLVTWLPQPWQHAIGYRFGYHHLRQRYASGCDRRDLCLLSRGQLRRLFPGSIIIRNGVVGFTPTWIAAGGEVLEKAAQAMASAPPGGETAAGAVMKTES